MTHLGTDLAVHRHGHDLDDGPVLLLLHGLTDAGTGWPRAVARWSPEYAVVAPDQRGHGRSPRFTEEELARHPGEVMVEDALTLAGRLPLPPLVVGHSLGGAVALAAAVRSPELFAALVLEDPAPRWDGEPQVDPSSGAGLLEGVLASAAAKDDEELLALRRAAHPDWPEDELLVTGRAEQDTDTAYLERGDLRPVTPWQELFARVQVPVLVVTGDGDGICVTEEVEAGIAALGNQLVRVERLAGAGHCVRRDRPTSYHALVDPWLREHAPTTA